jgi:tRNA-dihydrouridine synthase A
MNGKKSSALTKSRRLSVAPMMEYTDRFQRQFMRLITRHSLLYSEMITTHALLHGDVDYLLRYHPNEHPVALQLGGSDPAALAQCAKLVEEWGYDEVNLNVGCPSDRVSSGRFGACLMNEPEHVAVCVAAMKESVSIPVTIKSRIGIDDNDSYEALSHFIQTVAKADCDSFIVHARKAWLSGLSPKQNREVPPLRYDVVQQLKLDFPHLEISINGGIKTLDTAAELLQSLDGVMIGREAYQNPWMLAEADRRIFGDDHAIPARHEVVERYLPFVEQELSNGIKLTQISRHLLGLFHGCPGARSWRRYISENAHLKGAGPEVLVKAAQQVPEINS